MKTNKRMEKATSVKINNSTKIELTKLKAKENKSIKSLIDEAVQLLLLKRKVLAKLSPTDDEVLIHTIYEALKGVQKWAHLYLFLS